MFKWLNEHLETCIIISRAYLVLSVILFVAVGTPTISDFPTRALVASFFVAGYLLFFNFNRLSMKGQIRATSKDDQRTLKTIKAQANLFIAFGFFLIGSGLLGIISGSFSNMTIIGFNIPFGLILGTLKAKQEFHLS